MDIKTLKEAALKFGTPIYLYDLKIIQNQFDKLIKELSVLNDYKIHFAAKSLSNISILKFIRRQGAGLDAVSIEEVRIGLKCGFLKDEIISLLETHALPLILSNLIKANFWGSFIRWLISFKGLSLICEPGKNMRDPVSMCSTMQPPLHFDVIFPIIGSFFS